MPHFDLLIIGSGSGNSLMTPDLADRRIALVEGGTFGGTCLNVGCIPTKMYVYPADLADAAAHSERLGLRPQRLAADWPAIRDRIFGRIDPIAAGGREYRRSGTPNLSLYESSARFVGDREVKLDTGETITADQVVVAAGSRAVVPDLVNDSGVKYHTSDTVMRIDELPERIVILGGGFVAAEFAHVFSAFGTQVTVVARSTLLRGHDQDISARMTDLAREKWHLHTATTAVALRDTSSGITVDLSDGDTVTGDVLLVATGRRPNSDTLDPESAGIDVHPDGRIVVDEYQRTTAEGVWAIGDVCNPHQLKHVANLEARTVAHNLAHPDDLIAADHRFVPSAVFTHPQIATVGLTEQEATARGIDFVSVLQHYSSTAYGWAMEDATGFCKLLADPRTGRLLGAHILGEQAATLIQPVIQAMSFGLDARTMARGQYWIHPALTEVIENALLALPLN